MSAFVVQDKTISIIVSWLYSGDKPTTFRNDLQNVGIDTSSDRWDHQLAQNMLDLNIAAVNQRYDSQDESYPVDYRYVLTNDVQVYKSLRCWLYQCSEGDIPEHDLFKVMNGAIKDYLSYKIISVLPQYDQAKWD